MLLKRFNVEREANDQAEIARMIAEGYEPIGEEPADEGEEIDDLFSLTVKDLRDLAKARGIEGAKSLKKAELIEILMEGGEA